MTNFYHPFHLVSPSPWPLLTSLSIFNNLTTTVAWMHSMNYMSLITIPATLLCAIMWWRDVTREATFSGFHSKPVYSLMRLGMILFIISEIFFFMSFFWAYFYSSLAPTMEIGQLWPPSGIIPFNPFNIPLLNTIILISSELMITWSHHAMLNKNYSESTKSLFMTILLGVYFSGIQLMEYMESPFTIADSVYGSTFFMATGFHGCHVIIGTIFLVVTLNRMINLHFSSKHHFGFEAAAWYWHFVDVVWLFLYIVFQYFNLLMSMLKNPHNFLLMIN